MGLDVALGIVILVAAFRGWFQGFVSQAVRIAGLVACVYLAEPVRDYAKPYVLPYLPTIQPELIDRLLWWVAAAVSYVVIVGFASLVVKMTRRPEIPGMAQSGRNDQFAGFIVGAAKGLVVAAFATAALQRYGMEPMKTVPWAEEQVKTSWAAKWNQEYHPAPRIWASPPVRHFVNYVERMGLRKPGDAGPTPTDDDADGEVAAVRTASRPGDPETARDTRRASDQPTSTGTPRGESAAEAERLDPADQAIADLKAELKRQPN